MSLRKRRIIGPSFPYYATPIAVATAPPVGYSAEAQQFIDRLVSDPGTAQKDKYAALIDTLVAQGVWSGLDILSVYACDPGTTDSANALVNLPNATYAPSTLLGTPTPTYTPFFGFTPDGTTGCKIDPHFVPDTANLGSAHFKTDAACIFAWCVTAPGNQSVIDTDGATLNLYPYYNGVTTYIRVNDNPADGQVVATGGTGLFFGARTSGTGRTVYRNKLSLGTLASAPSGGVAPGIPLLVGESYPSQIACIGIGGNLDAVQDKLYDALRTYMTAVGVP